MKKRILALLMAMAMCTALAACSSSDDVADETEDAGDESTTPVLNVGFIGPLTGAAALYGVNVNQGAQIAVDEINAMGGDFQIAYNPMDDEHDPEKAVNAYQQLQDWGAQIIIGTVTTSPCVAVASEAFADRMFMLTPSASSTSVTEYNDNVYQICFSDPNQGTASAQYIVDNGLATKVGVIYNNGDAYSSGIYETFAAAADEMGLEIVSVTTFTDDTANDFSVQLMSAQQSGAELIFLPIYYTPASLILSQANAMDYAPMFFGCDGLDGILAIDGFDIALAEGLMLLTPFAADATDDATVSFVTKYAEAYNGEVPSQFAADGYDCVYAIYNAVLASGADVTTITSEELCELLIATFSSEEFVVDGLTGEGMTWDASGEVSKDPKAVVIVDGVYTGM